MGSNGNTVLGVLAGTAIGAAIGILFAPDKGSETRKKIAKEATNAKEKIAEEAALAKEKINQTAIDLKDRVASTAATKKQTLNDKVNAIVLDTSHKADDVITALELKLAELKTKNKKLQKSS